MTARKFVRTIEDFTCEKCGTFVKGDGYTDHCPACLWSKHVDINPGDRASECGGMLEPVGIEVRSDKNRIHYICQKCKKSHRVRVSPGDDSKTIISLSTTPLGGQRI
jgi:Zn finger protein HypA/HybF involved in hydrogenase expression